jgi:hypothetical protein
MNISDIRFWESVTGAHSDRSRGHDFAFGHHDDSRFPGRGFDRDDRFFHRHRFFADFRFFGFAYPTIKSITISQPNWASVARNFSRVVDNGKLVGCYKKSDIQLELEFTGRGPYRKVKSLGFANHDDNSWNVSVS